MDQITKHATEPEPLSYADGFRDGSHAMKTGVRLGAAFMAGYTGILATIRTSDTEQDALNALCSFMESLTDSVTVRPETQNE